MSTVRAILASKWFWIIVIAATLIVIIPFICILLILFLPPPFNAFATIGIFLAWGVAAAYKDWILSKVKEEERKS